MFCQSKEGKLYASVASILALFEELNRNGTTIIMVTHDENVARQTNRLIRILDGRLQSDMEVQHAGS